MRKSKEKTKKNKFIVLIVVAAIIILSFFIINNFILNKNTNDIHKNIDLSEKEKSYYDVLIDATKRFEEMIIDVPHIYFDIFNLPQLSYLEKENIAKKMLHSFEIHKDKELLLDSFDGLYYRNILNMETSELDGAIFISFDDLNSDKNLKETIFKVTLYKSSEMNPSILYSVKLNEDGKIINSTFLRIENPEDVLTDDEPGVEKLYLKKDED